MQWTDERHGGFSRARTVVRPAIADPVYGFEQVNVAAQRRDPDSLLNWTERMIRTRRECPEISWGSFTVLRTNVPEVLVLRYDWRDTSLMTLHNFADRTSNVRLRLDGPDTAALMDVFGKRNSRAQNDGSHRITLEPYGWRWFRVGSVDTTLNLADITITPDMKVR
jgi:maltose alpha-D-glucosyltransferase/alpha-amylase